MMNVDDVIKRMLDSVEGLLTVAVAIEEGEKRWLVVLEELSAADLDPFRESSRLRRKAADAILQSLASDHKTLRQIQLHALDSAPVPKRPN